MTQQALVKNNKAAEYETIQLAVGGSFDDGGNVVLTTIVSNLRKEMPIGTVVEITKDDEENDVVKVIAKYGTYEIDVNGRIEKLNGIKLNKTSIIFTEGEINSPVELTINSAEDISITSVSWSIANDNGLVKLDSASGTKTTISLIETPTKASATVTANVTTSDGKTQNLNCTVNYVEKTVATIEIISENEIIIEPNETREIRVQGKGPLGGRAELTSEDINKISYISSFTNYVVVSEPDATTGAGTITGVKSTVALGNIEVKYDNKRIGFVKVIVRVKLDYIDLGSDINGSGVTTDDWVLWHDATDSDDSYMGGKIYCMLADYLPNTYKINENDQESLVEKAGLTIVEGTKYNVNSTSREELVTALKDSPVWNLLISEEYSSVDGIDVYGGLGILPFIHISNNRPYKDYYIPHYTNYEGCGGYWFAANHSLYGDDGKVYVVRWVGDSVGQKFDSTSYGVLPIVTIQSSAVTLTKTNGIWKINVNE